MEKKNKNVINKIQMCGSGKNCCYIGELICLYYNRAIIIFCLPGCLENVYEIQIPYFKI